MSILGLLLDVVRDRERDPVVLEADVEDLVVEEGGRLWFEEDTPPPRPVEALLSAA